MKTFNWNDYTHMNEYKWFAVNSDGTACLFVTKPLINKDNCQWVSKSGCDIFIEGRYDNSNWRLSSIKRPKVKVKKYSEKEVLAYLEFISTDENLNTQTLINNFKDFLVRNK